MEFRTKITPPALSMQVDHFQCGLSLGSCFAENIATRMARAKFPITSNPLGIMFNPFSIADALERLDSGAMLSESDLVWNAGNAMQNAGSPARNAGDHAKNAVGTARNAASRPDHDEGMWHSFLFHGSFGSPDRACALAGMNAAIDRGAEALRKADYVILTFGTAWVYELAEGASRLDESASRLDEGGSQLAEGASRLAGRGGVVANCHKFPAATFRRRQLSVEEIVERYAELLKGPLKDKHIILTVSPIRHLSDGASENSASKATLLLAAFRSAKSHHRVDYFPAYEIVMDDLRDYRFYKEDMVHPSEVAVNYIWELFRGSALTPRAVAAAAEAEKIAAAANHRPLNPGTISHRKFLYATHEKVLALMRQYPEIDFGEELSLFSNADFIEAP